MYTRALNDDTPIYFYFLVPLMSVPLTGRDDLNGLLRFAQHARYFDPPYFNGVYYIQSANAGIDS